MRPWRRRRTRVVKVGGVPIGGDFPIVAQSMTVTDTMDTRATVDQIAALAAAGCPIVRVTAPSLSDAKNLAAIKAEMARRGLAVPLVADIHFTPNAAIEACEHVEKVRVNPGNYADRKHFATREYTDEEYAAELLRLQKAFTPLLLRAKERGVALRIGTNHGSLSDRIMNRFGDTPRGMVESALEFVRICREHDFHDIVLSAKASSVRVMVDCYRLMAATMDELQMDYPLHLGVTEAGDGEDGRIKSAIGIGLLLLEGLGDTIRVSLTEDPAREVPVCHEIVEAVRSMVHRSGSPELWARPEGMKTRRPAALARVADAPIGASEPPRVWLELGQPLDSEAIDALLDRRPSSMAEMRPEGIELSPRSLHESREALALSRRLRGKMPVLMRTPDLTRAAALASEGALLSLDVPAEGLGRDALAAALKLTPRVITFVGHPRMGLGDLAELVAAAAPRIPNDVIVAFDPGSGPVLRTEGTRALAATLSDRNPLLLRAGSGQPEDLVRTSIELGSLLVDGIGDVISAPAPLRAPLDTLRILYNVLQSSGSRISKTEFISCPSCGRTFFDLEATTARIKERTSHLKGVRIAIMGCIVNGPGEMADADFGYVGASPGMVHLFVGKDLVERNVPAERADERLVELIKAHGKWVEPVPAPEARQAG